MDCISYIFSIASFFHMSSTNLQDKTDTNTVAVLTCGAVVFGLTIGVLGGVGLFLGLWWSLNYSLIVSAAIAAPGEH